MSEMIQIPAPQPAELLEQLAIDPQTSGLANLTQRLIAALKIPMQARTSIDQSFGGVSDITNRGNFDRLLLSELAHDDLVLMARLANNEALYLRREELPSNDTRQRLIVIDTSIKMWGTPRLFAIATALACRINNKERARISTFALQGNEYSEIALLTKADIIGALAELSPALHSAGGLAAFAKEHPLHKGQEYFLITDEQLFYKPAFQAAFAHLRNAHGFLITVSRSGQLQLFKYTTGNRRLLLNITLDLPELLSKTKQLIENKKTARTGLPAFLDITPAPLYFPSGKIRPEKEYMFEATNSVINITQDQRLLYWPDRSSGARELLSFITPARYYFGQIRKMIYILMHIESAAMITTFRMLKIDTDTLEIITTDYKHDVRMDMPYKVEFHHELFILDSLNTTHFFNPTNNRTWSTPTADAIKAGLNLTSYANFSFKEAKRYINNGYSVLNNILKIYVEGKYLMLDNRTLILDYNSNSLSIKRPVPNGKKESFSFAEKPTPVTIKDAEYKLDKFSWDNGCEAFLDSRGLLHLRCPDKPEVTIVLILNRSVACWASDGTVCGSPYFIGNNPKTIPVRNFYDKYIQSFIDALK
jgi:hypothetical protein